MIEWTYFLILGGNFAHTAYAKLFSFFSLRHAKSPKVTLFVLMEEKFSLRMDESLLGLFVSIMVEWKLDRVMESSVVRLDYAQEGLWNLRKLGLTVGVSMAVVSGIYLVYILTDILLLG